MSIALTMRSTISRLTGCAGASGVQVHDVQGFGALGLPVTGELDGVVAEHRDVLEVAAAQPDRLSALDVDGWEDDHVAASCVTCATKLARRRSPTDELFSGWNCTAQTLSRARAATTGPP